MSDPQSPRESLLRTVVISLACAVVGLTLIVTATILPEGSLGRVVLQEFATILMISGGVGVVLDLFTRRPLLAAIESRLGELLDGIRTQLVRVSAETGRVADNNLLATRVGATGLSELITTNQSLNALVEHRLRTARSITIIMNDARTWVSWMQTPIRKRLQDSDLRTRIVVLDPASDMIHIQARKEGRSQEQIQEKIQATVETISTLAEELGAASRIEIWCHDLYNTHTVWLDPDVALVALYNLTPGLADTIGFAFSRTEGDVESVYDQLAGDVTALLASRHSRQLYPIDLRASGVDVDAAESTVSGKLDS